MVERSRLRMLEHETMICRFHLADRPADQANLADLEQFSEDRRLAAKRTVTQATIGKDLKHLRAALRFAKAKGLIAAHVFDSIDPADAARLMPTWKPEETKGVLIPPAHLAAILEALTGEARRIVRFLAETGLRKMEACSLDWASHWRDLPYPHFAPLRQKKNGQRKIPFESVAEIIGEPKRSGLVFAELGDTPQAIYARVTSCWRYAVEKLEENGLRHYRPHDLRHTFGTMLRRDFQTGDIASVMQITPATAALYVDHETDDLTLKLFRARPPQGTKTLSTPGEASSLTSTP